MTLFQRLRNMALISVRRKKYYFMHYKMWDYIVTHLQSDSEDRINDTEYIAELKRIFTKSHHYNQIFLNCFLCDLYYGTLKCNDCSKCPLYKLYNTSCTGNTSPFHIVISRNYKRDTRIKAAKIIRDCVLKKGGLKNESTL